MPTKGTKEWSDHSINFCRGCSNNCVYCYAKGMAKNFNREFPSKMVVNDKAVSKNYKKLVGRVMIPTSHDIPSNPPEILAAGLIVIGKLLEAGNELLITLKPDATTVRRICEKFTNYRSQILFRFTITSTNPSLLAIYEPNAPSFAERKVALSIARMMGYKTSISIEPFLEDPLTIIKALPADSITDTIWIGSMNKKYCPTELWQKIWEKKELLVMRERIEALNSKMIRFKDSIPLPDGQKEWKELKSRKRKNSVYGAIRRYEKLQDTFSEEERKKGVKGVDSCYITPNYLSNELRIELLEIRSQLLTLRAEQLVYWDGVIYVESTVHYIERCGMKHYEKMKYQLFPNVKRKIKGVIRNE